MGSSLEVLGPVGHAGGSLVRTLMRRAIDGAPGMPDVKSTAGNMLSKRGTHDKAIEAIIRQHTTLAGAQGFVTNIGGFAALPITLPTNLTGVAILEMRMVACIAHLRGYDVDDDRVRTAILMCLLDKDTLQDLADEGLPSSPLLVATAPVFNAHVDKMVSERVVAELLSHVGGTRGVTLVGRRIPLVGGGVGAALDGWSMWQVAGAAKEHLVDRRPQV